jgi:elongation factor G
MQIELIASRLRNQFKLNVEMKTPKIAYRETITAQGEGRYRHKKQSGGRGQFGEVQMRLRPLERGKQFEFINSYFRRRHSREIRPGGGKGSCRGHGARDRGRLSGCRCQRRAV